ncbi:dihydropteroate synthase [Planctomycetota bacterium]
MKSSVSSLYQTVELEQSIKPLLIGERCNANGSKKFRELLLADDFDGCLQIALEQQAKGAQVLDICVAYAGRDEAADMLRLVGQCVQSVKSALMIDSTTPDVLEAVLKMYPGRCIINSINLEDGGKNLNRICPLAKKYGAAVVALTINEQGMAMTTEEKIETARSIYDLAVNKHGLRPHDLLFDTLTFTIASGDETLRDAGVQTLDAIKRLKTELPGVFTVLGLSNISFGLRPQGRKVLNAVFLHEAVQAGLDVAIVDVAKVMPFAQIDEAQRELAMDLVYDRAKNETRNPLMAYIDYFEDVQATDGDDRAENEETLAEAQLSQKVIKGQVEGLDDVLAILLGRQGPIQIINELLIPAMRHVGELFGRGDMLLPFVLQSAEVMKKAVAFLEPFMEKLEDVESTKVLLATVQGDVHDIGKNLVDIILSNNGYQVYNLGIKMPAETIIAKAQELDVDIIGLSGLLVKSALVMAESMAQYQQAGLKAPILLGGAALTPKFVAESCVPKYESPVVYCADAFAGLKAVQDFEEGTLVATQFKSRGPAAAPVAPSAALDVRRDNPVPTPPFWGFRHVTDIDAAPLFDYINQQALFRGRWGYRRGKLSAEDYQDLTENQVRPLYEQLKSRCLESKLVRPRAAYGYFRCFSRDNEVILDTDLGEVSCSFPRQALAPHLCITDYFKTADEGGDVAGFFVVTIGEAISKETKALYESDNYHDYLMLHGLSVEVTDALAEYWHEVMRNELSIGEEKPAGVTGYVTQQYQGSRYGFGYPACPDMSIHEPLWQLLKPEAIGVTLTESMEMVPEQSTSALVVHHPQAKYFAV